MRKAFIVNDTTCELHYGCERVIYNLTRILNEANYSCVGSSYVGEVYDNIVTKIKTADPDLVAVNGEGTLHSNNPYWKTIRSLVCYAKEKRIKIVLLNSSVYLSPPETEFIKNFDKVFVRSTTSQKLLETTDIFSTYVPDLSFLDTKKVTNINGKETIYTDSVLPAATNSIFRAFKGSQDSRFISFIRKPEGVISGHLRFLKRLAGGKPTIVNILKVFPVWLHLTLSNKITLEDIDKEFSNANLIVTGRFHATCFAIKYSKNVTVISSNTSKIEDLLEDVGVLDLFEKTGPFKSVIDIPEYQKRVAIFLSTLPEIKHKLIQELSSLEQ